MSKHIKLITMSSEDLSQAAKKLSDMGAAKGGNARAKKLSPERRSEIASKAAKNRWNKQDISSEQAAPHQPSSQGLDGEELSEQAAPHQPSSQGLDGEELSEQASLSGGIQVSTEDLETELIDLQDLPVAIYGGSLDLVGIQLPCYVLNNGQRVIGRASANQMLTGFSKAGGFEQTIGVKSLKPFLDADNIIEQFVAFTVKDVQQFNNSVKGMPADLLIDVCQGFVAALQDSYYRTESTDYPELTPRQKEMAVKASMFLGAVAKVGLDALIDEVTGYQEVREKDALAIKLQAYLADEMRKWEKTFPDELWMEFGRLTNWKGSINKRPKYWGKLVMELIYEYLDPDVAQWLRENAPKPKGGQNYHQWLTSQYGLKKLVEHIWMVIGMSRACETMPELKEKMAMCFGNEPIQLKLSLPRSR
jgi:P63C domain